MGKTRYTQNQDYFKLSGSSPGPDMAAAARRAFGMERARERLSMFLHFSPPKAQRSQRPRAAVTPAEVIPSQAPPKEPITTEATAESGPPLQVRVPPLRLFDVAWDVAYWPLLLIGRGWRLVRRTWGDVMHRAEKHSGRYLGLG